MNIGTNLQTWLLAQAQPIVLAALAVIGVVLLVKKEYTKLLQFAIIAVIAVVLVYNPGGMKDVLLKVGNKIFGAKSK